MKTLISSSATTLVAVSMIAGRAFANPPAADITPKDREKVKEETVFVTGSLIPQRVKLHPIATTTVSPLRIIDRREIDQTGRRTTAGALVNEPSVRIIGR